MSAPYFCPQCHGNRTRFALIRELSQEVKKDPATGNILYAAYEWEEVLMDGKPFLKVICLSCGFTDYERIFINAARADKR